MRKLLEEFWYGNIFPQEQYAAQHPDIKPLLRLADKNRTSLVETLTEAQQEILQKYAGHVILNIHIKPHGENYNREIFRQIIDLIDRYDCRRHVYIMGETDDLLALSKELAPDIPRCVGFQGEDVDMVDVALRFDCKKIQLYRPYFDQDYVDRAHANGIICNVFWSDEEELTEKYLDMGIDTILSNDYWSTAQIVERYKKEHLL